MMRLIDADALVNALSAAKDTAPELLGRPIIDVSDMVRMIEDLPTIDAVPVEWIEKLSKHKDMYTRASAQWVLGCWERKEKYDGHADKEAEH